jgi:hypothetical protein
MPKTHDREHFYKYYTSEAAKTVLSKLEMLWSSPLTFNDPFDSQFDLNVHFDVDEFRSAFLNALRRFVSSDEKPQYSLDARFESLLTEMRRNRERVPWDRLERELGPLFEDGFRSMQKSILESNDQWRRFLSAMRIFCLTEVHDDLLMWAHYSQGHTGVVLKFRCLPEHDTAMCAARQVIYTNDIPSLATVDEWVNHFFGSDQIQYGERFMKLAVLKSAHWSYEREWRVVLPLVGDRTSLRSTYNLRPEEIDTVFLGCKITPSDRETIIKILATNLKHVKLLQAKPHGQKFALGFEQLR